MGMSNLAVALEAATDNPLLFVLYTVIFFALIMMTIAVIAYVVLRNLNQKTKMAGVMRVKVTLNEVGMNQDKIDKGVSSPHAKLDYGEYLVGMEDTDYLIKLNKYLLNPQLNWLEEASLRTYPVEAFLGRFYMAFQGAGFGENEPASVLLKALLQDDIFCMDLGRIFRLSKKKGLTYLGKSTRQDNAANPNQLQVCTKVPENPAAIFKQETGCVAQTISIALEYVDSLKIDEL